MTGNLPAVAEDRTLVNVVTGEVLPATVENAAAVIRSARAAKARMDAAIEDATGFLRVVAAERGTKTFRTGDAEVSLAGGPSVEYDPEALASALRAAGCPEDRIDAAVVAQVVFKVNRSVLRQLAAANPTYAEAARGAERLVEKRWYAKVAP